jgi:hypothetical protein
MPARREKIYICPREDGQPAWIMDFPLWWDRRAFFEKFGDRKLDTGNPIYVDYGLLLTNGEAMAWDKRCREAFSGVLRPHIAQAMDRLAPRLKSASWVIVESYEWESGLG